MAFSNTISSRLTGETRREERGFALLVTIVLVAFLVLILVGLATFTRVETQVAANSQQLSLARQNAMTGLNIAIGQLQRYAGADHHVTARADITAAGLNHPYFTGAWLSTNNGISPSVWFVNGNETNPTAVTPNVLDPAAGTFPVSDTTGPTGEVFLLGRSSVDTDAERIRVAKSNLDAPAGSIPGVTTQETIGHYAYWIGDEGVKASVSMVDPNIAPATRLNYSSDGDDWSGAPNDKRDRLNQLAIPRPRIERILTAVGFNPDSVANATELSKVILSNQLQFVSNAPALAMRRAAFHSITPISEAVLADWPRNQLKKDLTDTAAANTAGLAVTAFRDARVSTPASGYVATYGPVAVTPSNAIATASLPAFSAGPVLREFGIRFYFTSDSTGAVTLNYLVEAVLWNPYSATLKLTPATEKLRIVMVDLPTITVRDTAVSGATADVNLTTLLGPLNFEVDGTEVWAPGEVKSVSGISGTLTAGGGQGTIATGVKITGGSTVNEVSFPAYTALAVDLRWGPTAATLNTTLQEYRSKRAYTARTVSRVGGWTSMNLGYGFALADSVDVFTNGDAAGAVDPRSPVLTGGDLNNGLWDPDASLNGGVAVSSTLDGQANVVLFDLPRQGLISVADLRNLSRLGNTNIAAPLGNGWGGVRNAYFDSYFFSTVPSTYAWKFEVNDPLPNRYVRYYAPSDTPAPSLANDLRDEDSARFLMMKGAFNINSTSIDAWRMILGGRLNAWLSESSAGAQVLDNVFFRLTHGAQQMSNAPAANGTVANNIAVTTGGRQLSVVEVKALATQIVAVIKTNSKPFKSLEDFLTYPGAGGERGVIAKAITLSNLNNGLGANFRFAPAAITQADVVASIAPFITPRSDTFLIRTYGDSQNPVTGVVEGRVWGEAVVQRVPEPVGLISPNLAEQLSPTGKFGRKFKIVSFRWLTRDDL